MEIEGGVIHTSKRGCLRCGHKYIGVTLDNQLKTSPDRNPAKPACELGMCQKCGAVMVIDNFKLRGMTDAEGEEILYDKEGRYDRETMGSLFKRARHVTGDEETIPRLLFQSRPDKWKA